MAAKVRLNSQCICYLLFVLSAFSSVSFIYLLAHFSPLCKVDPVTTLQTFDQSFSLLSLPSSLNQLSFSPDPPSRKLKIALFVKKWPQQNLAGGLERHALTLHLALARRGHEVHIFTTSSDSARPNYPNAEMNFHQTPQTHARTLNQSLAWEQFRIQNSTEKPFDLIHTESVGLFHTYTRNICHVAVSWHGIAYETIHSDIVQDLLRGPEEAHHDALTSRVSRVLDEVKFFRDYAHHVATSDHVGEVLKRVYMIPEERVHIIVNGVDEEIYSVDSSRGDEFKRKVGVPDDTKLVIGMAGRLVRDKGHPLMFKALKLILMESESFRQNVVVLVAGDGPWGKRYKELGPNLYILGPLEQSELAMFYNSLDVFLNPTLRAQGLDHTFIEAMISGVSIMGTRFASITGSLITGEDIGYTFSPTVDSLKESLYKILRDGKEVLKKKGKVARRKAERLFTATKMAAAYERLFLCISREAEGNDNVDYCTYPLPWDYMGDV